MGWRGRESSVDTLSGIVAGLAARGAPPEQAAVWAVALHARAGDRLARTIGPLGFLPRELLAEIPRLMARLAGGGRRQAGGGRGRGPGIGKRRNRSGG